MNIRQSRNTIFAFTKPERKTISHFYKETKNTIFACTRKAGATNNCAQQAIYRLALTFSRLAGGDSHQICLPVFFASGLQKHTFYHDFSLQINDAHVKMIPRLETNQASSIVCEAKQWRKRAALRIYHTSIHIYFKNYFLISISFLYSSVKAGSHVRRNDASALKKTYVWTGTTQAQAAQAQEKGNISFFLRLRLCLYLRHPCSHVRFLLLVLALALMLASLRRCVVAYTRIRY